jgi:hypothetical protein
MSDELTVLFDEGHDIHNEPLATLDVEMKGYVDWKTHLVRDQAGEQVISRGMVYIIYSRQLNHKDRIKNINGDGIEYAILDIRDGKDFSKNHQEVHLA